MTKLYIIFAHNTALPSSLLFTEVLHVYKRQHHLPGISLGQLASHLTSPRCQCSSEKDKQIFLEENFFVRHHGDVKEEGAGAPVGGGDNDRVRADAQLVRRWRGKQWGKSDEVPAGI